MFRKVLKVDYADGRQIRRWLAWSTLINFVIMLIYIVTKETSGDSWEPAILLIMLSYNYLLARFVVTIPKRTLTLKSYRYLSIPLATSFILVCVIILLFLFTY